MLIYVWIEQAYSVFLGVFFVGLLELSSSFKRFYADHPFMYFIREKTTGSILFMGRYVAPPGEGGELPRVGELNYQLNFDYVESSTQNYRTTPEVGCLSFRLHLKM